MNQRSDVDLMAWVSLIMSAVALGGVLGMFFTKAFCR
jgi:hypothetical protein